MQAESSESIPVTHFEVVIIGSGFSGLCMAIKLREQGEQNFIIIERAARLGGTWRDNNYPGAACDVPSHLYSLSFEAKHDWARKYSNHSEIQKYLETMADKYQLLPRIQFNSALQQASWCERENLWRIQTSSGHYTAKKLICGTGGLAEPKLPDILGVQNFEGHCFHSSQWDHHYSLAGKRVAVIGTGASAIQFVPEIAPHVSQLHVFQRTPNWIIPRFDRAYSRIEKRIFKHVPIVHSAYRALIFWVHESRALGIFVAPWLMNSLKFLARMQLRLQVANIELRKTLTPNYALGCKRIVISNVWYPALNRANVNLVSESIQEVREHSIVTADGKTHEIDCLIFATGFYATQNPIAELIHGKHAVSLAHAWQNGEEAFRGTLVKNFPNLFLLVGPNTALGHSSMIYMIETQVRYICRLLTLMKNSKTLEVRADVHDHYNVELQKKLRGSVWGSGCKSWYMHASGKITALWPDFCFKFARQLKPIRAEHYVLGDSI